MAFIRSPVILGYLQSIKYTDVSIYRLIAELRKATLDNQKQLMPETRRVPTVDLGFSVMSAKNSYRFPELRPSFERRSSKTPEIVFLANRRLYGQADAGKPIHDRSETYPAGHHLYREVLFTSTRVAKLLEGTSSKLGQTMLESFVGPDREIITGKNMGDAVVHSFSDPFYLPANKTWITGAINNLSALDISRLAEENFLGYRKTWSEIDIAVLQENFGFDPSVSDEKFVSATATGWMDMTVDRSESLAQKIKFSPSLHSWPSGFIRLKTNVPRGPNALEKYRQLVDSQYQAGVAQVKSMLSQPLGSKKHIEAPYHKGVKKKPKPRLFG
jgi:hypothetical protein